MRIIPQHPAEARFDGLGDAGQHQAVAGAGRESRGVECPSPQDAATSANDARAPWSVAVNASARNLETPGFAAEVIGLLSDAGVPPGRLTVEITETALASDAALVAACVEQLAAGGVDVSVTPSAVIATATTCPGWSPTVKVPSGSASSRARRPTGVTPLVGSTSGSGTLATTAR